MSNTGLYGYPGTTPLPVPTPQFPVASGEYFMVNRNPMITTFQMATGRIYYAPCYLSTPVPLATIGFRVTAAATAGKIVRIGRYDLNVQALPGNKIVDYGTGLADAIAGVEIVTTDVLPAGWFYMALVSDGGNPTLRSVATPIVQLPGSTMANAVDQNNFSAYETPGTAVLPATANVSSFASTQGNALLAIGKVA